MTDLAKGDYYRLERKDVEALVPEDAVRILDVGCGEGMLGRNLLKKGAAEVTGIELWQDAAKKAEEHLTSVICGDVEKIKIPFEKGYFDCMIFADILEHLVDPLRTLQQLREVLSDAGTVVACIPNVRYYGVLNMLVQGNWSYGEYGILDKTHLRFFTRLEIEQLFRDAGFEITGMTANVDPAFDTLCDPSSGGLSFGRVTLEGLSPEEVKDHFSFQYLIRGQKSGYELQQVNCSVEKAVQTGDIAKALEEVESYLELHSVDADMLYRHAELSIQSGDNDRAMESLRKIQIFYPERDDAQTLMTELSNAGTAGSSGNGSGAKKRIAIVRGANLNKWEMQNYEGLLSYYDITAYSTTNTCFDISNLKFNVRQLPYKQQGLLLEMENLEDELSHADIIFSADITYRFSEQAIDAKKKHGAKVVCLEWENIPFNYEEYEEIRRIKEVVRNGADHFIAVTERAKEALILEGVPPEIIDVVPMGIDLDVFRPAQEGVLRERERLGIGSGDLVIMITGRMVWEKGMFDFLHAAARIQGDKALSNRPVKFLVVGKGPELLPAHERARLLGVAGQTVFVEEYPYDKMYRLHNLADIFVLPSIPVRNWQEQFGMVLVESMACGKPVISTLSGSIPEVVGDAGILVQPNDHLSLYQAMKLLITDELLRKELSSKALSRAERLYDAKKTASSVREIFEKVLARPDSREKTKDDYARALELWEQGEPLTGFDRLCKAFWNDPERKDILESIIDKGSELNKHHDIEQCVSEYLTCHPADLDMLVHHAACLTFLERYRDAEEQLDKVSVFDPERQDAAQLRKHIQKTACPVRRE